MPTILIPIEIGRYDSNQGIDTLGFDECEIEEILYDERRRRIYWCASRFARAHPVIAARLVLAWRNTARRGGGFGALAWFRRRMWAVRRWGPSLYTKLDRWLRPEKYAWKPDESTLKLRETAKEARAALVASRHTKAASN
jgi:hypothetical protein